MNLFVDRHLQNLSKLNLGVIEMINFEPKYFVSIAFWVCQPIKTPPQYVRQYLFWSWPLTILVGLWLSHENNPERGKCKHARHASPYNHFMTYHTCSEITWHDNTHHKTIQTKLYNTTLNNSTKRNHVLNKTLGDSTTVCTKHANISGNQCNFAYKILHDMHTPSGNLT